MLKYLILSYIALAFLLASRYGVRRNVAACGLFGGLSAYLSQGETDVITTMGYISSLRGVDSTGLLIGHGKPKKRAYGIVKDTLTSPEFLSSGLGKQALGVDPKFLILGHCRAATHGDITADNAHPYKVDHIYGAHNGTIHRLSDRVPGRTDSYAFFKILSERGLEAAIEECGAGAYAFVWIDAKNRTLNVLRNEQRTLFMAYPSQTQATVFWASEENILRFAMHREKVGIHSVEAFEPNVLHQIDTAQTSGPFVFKKIRVAKKESSTVFKSSRERIKYVGENGVFYKHTWNEELREWVKDDNPQPPAQSFPARPAATTPAEPSPPLLPKPADTSSIVDKGVFYKLWNVLLPLAQADPLLALGCFVCGKKCSRVENAHFFTRQSYVCQRCYKKDRTGFMSVFYNKVTSIGHLVVKSNGQTSPWKPPEASSTSTSTQLH